MDDNRPTPTPPASPWPSPTAPGDGGAADPSTPPRLSAAGWLAATGASLLLVASIVVVAGNWDAIGPEIRFSGLVAALVAVSLAAETGRRRLPATSRSLATLAAALTAPVGVAAAATLGQPWPVCTLVGGAAALGATELQSRRWSVPVLQAATVVAFGLFAVGLSALTSIPVGLIGAGGAVAALLLGSERRTAALAVAVGSLPMIGALAATGFAPGTLDRLGVIGDTTAWSVPIASAIAASVLAVIARRSGNLPLAVCALATLGIGVADGLLVAGVAPFVWWSLLAITLLAAEALGAGAADSVWRRIGRGLSIPLGATAAAVMLLLPYLVLDGSGLGVIGEDRGAALPLGLASLALLATACGSSRRSRPDWSSAAFVASAAALFAATVVLGAPLWLASIGALLSWGLVTTATSWTSWDLTTATVSSWVLLAQVVDETTPTWARASLLGAAALALVVAVSVRQRADGGSRLIVAASFIGLAAAALGTDEPALVGTLAFAGAITVGVTLRPQAATWPLASVSLIVYAVVNDGPASWWSSALVGVVAIAFAGSSRGLDDVRRHVAAALAVVSASLALAMSSVDAGTATMTGAVVGVALGGIALVDRRMRPALTAGMTATLVAVAASASASPVFQSIAITMLGVQLAVAGAELHGPRAATPGVVLATAGLASAWWTTGSNDWAIETIQPYGATGVDIVVGLLTCLLLVAGGCARRTAPVSSWLAYGPGLALGGTWLLASQLEPGTDWATLGALAVGAVALAIGGWRRLGAPLVAGTVMIGGSLVLSAGPRLAAAPTWLWIATAGVGLLVLAAFVERSERPLLPIGRRAATNGSWMERFCEEFR